ncbi:hypothetical protein [Proteiniclasticum ruminis]|uniref:Uncharacterized protein n=1 Tax=Proteiniclasticum ruminis TaxID=398199 RepID=A0A1I5DUA5_9CLOT|nr:hypothetical protein [Proteiniclasticum ruminis]SFO02766.1 hypothetical protein SAMN04488695_11120 [Proteiniclasticum ruminis]
MNKKRKVLGLILAGMVLFGVFGFLQCQITHTKKVLTETVENNLDQFIGKAGSLEPESLMMQYASLLAARDAYIVLQNQNLFFPENPDPSLAHLINEIHEMMKKEPEKFQSFIIQEGIGQKLYRIMDDFSNEELVRELYDDLRQY